MMWSSSWVPRGCYASLWAARPGCGGWSAPEAPWRPPPCSPSPPAASSPPGPPWSAPNARSVGSPLGNLPIASGYLLKTESGAFFHCWLVDQRLDPVTSKCYSSGDVITNILRFHCLATSLLCCRLESAYKTFSRLRIFSFHTLNIRTCLYVLSLEMLIGIKEHKVQLAFQIFSWIQKIAKKCFCHNFKTILVKLAICLLPPYEFIAVISEKMKTNILQTRSGKLTDLNFWEKRAD